MRRSRAAGKPRTGAPSAEALLLRARKDRSAKLQALLNREAEDLEWLARRLNVTYARASALVSGGCSVTPAEELAIERLLSGAA